MFPTFIIIGAMKCGTSSLYHYLSLQPQVGMSDIKEVDYFIAENNFDKGQEWYHARFEGDYEAYGEASPNYSKAHYFKRVPERMHKLLPNIKLIYLVRDPIERIISHYMHNYSEGREHKPIEEVLYNMKDNHYIMCSRYYWQLQHYLRYYSEVQLLVSPSYKLRDERNETLQQIFNYIWVDSSFYSSAIEEEKHQGSQRLQKGRWRRIVLESPVIKALKGLVPDGIKEPVKKAKRPPIERPTLDTDLKKRLAEKLLPGMEKLEDLSKYSLNRWSIYDYR